MGPQVQAENALIREVEVPEKAYFGVQTRRVFGNASRRSRTDRSLCERLGSNPCRVRAFHSNIYAACVDVERI